MMLTNDSTEGGGGGCCVKLLARGYKMAGENADVENGDIQRFSKEETHLSPLYPPF